MTFALGTRVNHEKWENGPVVSGTIVLTATIRSRYDDKTYEWEEYDIRLDDGYILDGVEYFPDRPNITPLEVSA